MVGDRSSLTSRPSRSPIEVAGPDDFIAAFGVSRETAERLNCYADLLKHWQKAQNLVSSKTLDEIWQRHFADSAQLLEIAPVDARIWCDLGSGAGFPGLVVAILLAGEEISKPARTVRLIESNGRKCAFLREVVRQTGIAEAGGIVEIINRRIESPPDSAKVEPADIITARALAPLERLLDLAAPYVASQSVALFLKGRDARQELIRAERCWRFTWNMISSQTDQDGHIIEIKNLRPV